jgi:hypothetical protein
MILNFDFGELKVALGIIAGIVAFLAYIFYIIAILKGQTKPERASWWIWSLMGIVLGTSYYFSGAKNTIWVPVAEVIGPLTIAILSLRYGEGGLKNKTDLVCLIGASFSIILWIIFKNPVIALTANVIVDIFAAVPTIKKSYLRPEGEDLFAWLLTGSANTMNLFAVEKFTFAVWLYPVYVFIIDLAVIILLILGRKNGRLNKV